MHLKADIAVYFSTKGLWLILAQTSCTVSCLTVGIQKPQEINLAGVAPQRWHTTVSDNESNSRWWKRSHTHSHDEIPAFCQIPQLQFSSYSPFAFCQLLPWTDLQLSPLDYVKDWPLTDCLQSWDVLMSHCVSQMKRWNVWWQWVSAVTSFLE